MLIDTHHDGELKGYGIWLAGWKNLALREGDLE
jgi:hypothetical protein